MTDAAGIDQLQTASLGEVAWVDDSGRPCAAGVLPLLLRGVAVVALTLDRSELAVALASAEEVDLVVREPGNTGRDWAPAAWRCATRLAEDLDGDVYQSELMLQELRRYPPARRFADSPLLAREHWWYLPRLLVELSPVEELGSPPPREGADDLLLVSATGRKPVVGGVRRSPSGLEVTWGAVPASGPGMVLGQEASFPDLEVWRTWHRRVEIEDARIDLVEPLPEPAPLAPPGVWQRWRADRRFESACRRGIEAWAS